jgi:hypothetical protein
MFKGIVGIVVLIGIIALICSPYGSWTLARLAEGSQSGFAGYQQLIEIGESS